jgi:hypothetical protein
MCGALFLPMVIKDSGARWGVGSALGVAVSALAAMWGYGFAVEGESEEESKTSRTSVNAEGEGSIAIGGSNHGTAVTSGVVAPLKTESLDLPIFPASPAGQVTARGNRSIAVGGDNVGAVSTGDGIDSER